MLRCANNVVLCVCMSMYIYGQVSPDSGLLQCSTVADLVDFQFADGQVGAAHCHACVMVKAS